MSSAQLLGKTYQLANCDLTRVDINDEHYYFVDQEFYVSVTRILDIAAPFPEGLRQWLRDTEAKESLEYMMMTRDRGSKLHGALELLANQIELNLADDYQTIYEKDAITTFARFMRFLQPMSYKAELVVANPESKVAGTLDFVANADKRRLDILLEPTKYLDLVDDQLVLKPKYADLLEGEMTEVVKFVLDYKFTGRSSYNHKVQAASYKYMYNLSYAKTSKRKGTDVPATRAFIWRYSPKHKHSFDLQESTFGWESFQRIFDTFIEYEGGFPEPPVMKVYPEKVKLFERIENV